MIPGSILVNAKWKWLLLTLLKQLRNEFITDNDDSRILGSCSYKQLLHASKTGVISGRMIPWLSIDRLRSNFVTFLIDISGKFKCQGHDKKKLCRTSPSAVCPLLTRGMEQLAVYAR